MTRHAPRGSFLVVSVGASLLAALLGACLVTVDDAKVDEAEATADASMTSLPSDGVDAAAANDAGDASPAAPTGCWDGSVPDQIVMHALAVSTSEVQLTFTPGPIYRLRRINTDEMEPDSPADLQLSTTCPTSSYDDEGVLGDGIHDGGGLINSYFYTYYLTVLLADGGVDPRFVDLSLNVETWYSDAGPGGAAIDAQADAEADEPPR